MKAYLAIFLLFFLFPFLSLAQPNQICSQESTVNALAPWYCNYINQAVVAKWSQWEPIALIASLIAFMIAVIIFAIGIATRNRKLHEFGIGELYEAVATMLIVILFLFLSAVLFGIIPSAFVGNIDPYTTALSYIAQNINQLNVLLNTLYTPYLIDSYYASTQLVVGIGPDFKVPISEVWAFPITVLFLTPVSAITQLLVDALTLLYTEFYLILFFMYASIPVFLIPGVILRAFVPTRALGGMMIAIAISFYFIMPTLFAVAFYVTSQSALSALATASSAISYYSQGTGVETNAVSPTSPLVLEVQDIQQGMGPFWMSILFYPALIIAITYQSIQIIANLIGGLAKTTSRLRMV